MQIKHTIIRAIVAAGDDVPVDVQQNIIGAPTGFNGQNSTAVLAGLNATNPAWGNADVIATYRAQGFAAADDIVEWAPAASAPAVAQDAPAA